MREPVPARERLLAAAADLYVELPLPALMRGLHPGALAKHADVSRTSFYANWDVVDDYWRDLVAHILADSMPATVDPKARVTERTFDRGRVRAKSRADFVAGLDRPTLPLLMALWSKADDPEIAATLRAGYRTALEPLVVRFESLLAQWGREVVAPLTSADVATLLLATADGLTVRHRFDPAAASLWLFEEAMAALVEALSRPVADPSGGDDIVALPTPPPVRVRSPGHGPKHERTHRAILDALERLLFDRPYSDVTIADIAQRARVSTTTVYEHFTNKQRIIYGLAFDAAVDLCAELDEMPLDVPIEECLLRVLEFVRARSRVFRGIHSARLEDPVGVPRAVRNNPIVERLAARIVHAVGDEERATVIAALWWRSLALGGIEDEEDMPAETMVLALVNGIRCPARDGAATP